VVEDNEINIRFARGLLQKLGHQVTVVRNGIEAVHAVSSSKDSSFDVALMDVQMPVMGGLEATEAIRVLERETGRHLPIIAMTANAMRGDRERCLEAGMDDYIAKPIDTSKLMAALRRLAPEQASGTANQLPARTRKKPKPAQAHASSKKDDAKSVFDREAVLDTLGDDPDAFRTLTHMLLVDHQGMLKDADEALATGDLEKLASIAHTLKGMVGNFAAQNTSKAARAFYSAAHTGRTEQAGKAYAKFKVEMETLADALRADPMMKE